MASRAPQAALPLPRAPSPPPFIQVILEQTVNRWQDSKDVEVIYRRAHFIRLTSKLLDRNDPFLGTRDVGTLVPQLRNAAVACNHFGIDRIPDASSAKEQQERFWRALWTASIYAEAADDGSMSDVAQLIKYAIVTTQGPRKRMMEFGLAHSTINTRTASSYVRLAKLVFYTDPKQPVAVLVSSSSSSSLSSSSSSTAASCDKKGMPAWVILLGAGSVLAAIIAGAVILSKKHKASAASA